MAEDILHSENEDQKGGEKKRLHMMLQDANLLADDVRTIGDILRLMSFAAEDESIPRDPMMWLGVRLLGIGNKLLSLTDQAVNAVTQAKEVRP